MAGMWEGEASMGAGGDVAGMWEARRAKLTHLSLEAVDAWTYLLGLDVVHSLRSACLLRLAVVMA